MPAVLPDPVFQRQTLVLSRYILANPMPHMILNVHQRKIAGNHAGTLAKIPHVPSSQIMVRCSSSFHFIPPTGLYKIIQQDLVNLTFCHLINRMVSKRNRFIESLACVHKTTLACCSCLEKAGLTTVQSGYGYVG